jgi:hypothetical protein
LNLEALAFALQLPKVLVEVEVAEPHRYP